MKTLLLLALLDAILSFECLAVLFQVSQKHVLPGNLEIVSEMVDLLVW